MHQFTFEPLHFCFQWMCVVVSDLRKKNWRIDGFGEKKGKDQRICIPLFSPPKKHCDYGIHANKYSLIKPQKMRRVYDLPT